MAKNSMKIKNEKRKKSAKKYSTKRAKLKETIYNRNLPMEERFEASLKLAKLPRNSSKTRIRNRCVLTGRPRGYYRKLGVCRNVLRELASVGQVPGMIKSSW